jgi:VWFA-related protein
MMSTMSRAVRLLLIGAMLAAAGWSEEPAEEIEGRDAPDTPVAEVEESVADASFSDQLEVTIVNIDVFVRDKRGNAVTDLEADDFVVRQDGEVQEITNFTVLTEEVYTTAYEDVIAPATRPAQRPEAEEPPSPVTRPIWVVLYVDSENLHPLHAARVLRRVREFVDESLRPPVQMMVVANQGGLKVLVPFTEDSREVNGVLRSVSTYSGGWVNRESTRSEIISDMRDDSNLLYGSNPTDSKKGRTAMYQRIVDYALEEANSLSFSLSAMRQVIDTLAGLDGRKSLIYVSEGLPMTPGLGLMHEYATVFRDNSILANHARFDRQQAYRSLTSAAASQEVVLYTIDAQGLEVGLGGDVDSMYEVDPTASRIGSSNYQASMRFFAERTGGIAVVNTNDVGPGLRRIREDLFTYYSIGFPVASGDQDRVHRLEVEVVGRDGVDVRSRRRFVERSLETRIRDQVAAGLLLGTADNPMSVRVERGRPVPATGDYWTVPVVVRVPVEALTLLPAGDEVSGHVLLIVGTRDEEGRQSDIQRQEHQVELPGAAEERPSEWVLDVAFLMREGQHRVVVGVLDRISRRVSYETLTLSVP